MKFPELRHLVERLAGDPASWRHLVRHDPHTRIYERIVDEADIEGWLICWLPGHDTGFHDHGVSYGAVTVVSGGVREARLRPAGTIVERIYSAGQTFDFTPSDIHRVSHAGDEPTVTLHVYSPRIVRAGAYLVGAGGELVRKPVPSGAELRPLDAVPA